MAENEPFIILILTQIAYDYRSNCVLMNITQANVAYINHFFEVIHEHFQREDTFCVCAT